MIMQGDNGTRLKLHIKENNVPLDLSGATIEVKIKQKNREIIKQAQITGNGEAEVELTSDDLATAGFYYAQAMVKYGNDNAYGSDIQRFVVGSKL